MQFFLWTLALLSIFAAGFFTYRADRRRAVPRPWLTAGLRTLLVALVWALLLAPTLHIHKNEIQKPVVLFLQDESTSIPTALHGDTAAYRKEANALIERLSGKYKVLRRGFGATIHTDSLFRYSDPATDIASALARSADEFSGMNLGAIVLATDGRYNQGLNPMLQSLSQSSPVYSICLGDTALPIDLRIPRLYAPRRVTKGAQVDLRADLVATGCKGFSGSVRILEAGRVLGSSLISIPSERYDKSVSFSIQAGSPGLHHYVVAVDEAAGEKNTANNRHDLFIEVVEKKKRILIATAAPHPDVAALRDALSPTDAYELTVKIGLPEDLSPYEVVILHGLVPDAQILQGNKPVWNILTLDEAAPQSRVAELNPAAPQDAYAALDPTFNVFSLPAGIQPVLAKLPPLRTAAYQARANGGTQVLFQSREGGSPLWLLQPGRPSAALLMGEGLWRWRLYEYRYFGNHDVVDECIRQTVAMLAAQTDANPFQVSQPKYEWSEGEQISFEAFLRNPAGQQINTPDAKLVVKDSSGHATTFSFDKQGAAYQLNIGQLPGGSYTWQATTQFEGKQYTAAGSFAVSTVPLEALETGADYGLLYGLSKKYGGQVLLRAQMASLYDSLVANPDIKPRIESRDIQAPLVDWKWYFLLILLVATAEWLLRKYWLAQ